MSLLTGPSLDMEKPRIHAVRALANFVVCLRCRIKCYQDPNLYTAKQGNIFLLIAWMGLRFYIPVKNWSVHLTTLLPGQA